MFRTVLDPSQSDLKITHDTPVITLGSCFADSIGQKLESNKFHTLTNPFGVIYNPLSLFNLLKYSITQTTPSKDTYVENQGIFYNYEFHSEFSALDKDELTLKVEGAIRSVHDTLKDAKWLFLTFGTSRVYHLKSTGQLVANCHKVPSSYFEKSMLSQKQIIESFNEMNSLLQEFNPEISIILTVSPVRHIGDTLVINSVSKSILRITCDTLQKVNKSVSYFPAYEILLDDLRDYRFYARDLIHPNEIAEDYIWEKFKKTYFDKETMEVIIKWQKILKSINHKPFHKDSETYTKFREDTLIKLMEIKEKIDVSKEIVNLQS